MKQIIQFLITFVGILSLIIGLIFISALIVQWLWNYLMPELFNLKEINFLQALAMMTLSSILFKNINFDGLNKNKQN